MCVLIKTFGGAKGFQLLILVHMYGVMQAGKLSTENRAELSDVRTYRPILKRGVRYWEG